MKTPTEKKWYGQHGYPRLLSLRKRSRSPSLTFAMRISTIWSIAWMPRWTLHWQSGVPMSPMPTKHLDCQRHRWYVSHGWVMDQCWPFAKATISNALINLPICFMDHAYNRFAQFNEWNTVGLKFNSFGDCVDLFWCGPSYCYITALLFDLTWLTQSGGCIYWQRLMSQILLTHLSCILICSPLEQFCFGSAYSRDKRLFCMGLGSLSAYGVWNVWSKLDAQCCHVSSWHVQSKKWVVEFCGTPTAADSEAVYLDRQKLVQQWVQLQRTWNQIVYRNTHEFQNKSTCLVHARVFESLRALKPSVEHQKCSHLL